MSIDRKSVDRDGMQFYEGIIITSDNDDYYNNPGQRPSCASAHLLTAMKIYATFFFLNCTLQRSTQSGEWQNLKPKFANGQMN